VQQYRIRQSPSLKILNLSLYLLVIFTILTFADEIWLAGLLVLLAMLLMISDWLRLRSEKLQTTTALTLYPDSGEIEIRHLDHCQRFKNFTPYINRWFVILKLRNRDVSRHFLLSGERFGSMTEYLNFRRQILEMSRDQYVA
jgi:hypothetical protein